jgi:hypothetical protein
MADNNIGNVDAQQSTYVDYPNAEDEQKKCMAFLHDYMDGAGIPKYYDMLKEIANRERKELKIEMDDMYDHFQDDQDWLQTLERNTARYVKHFEKSADLLLSDPANALQPTVNVPQGVETILHSTRNLHRALLTPYFWRCFAWFCALLSAVLCICACFALLLALLRTALRMFCALFLSGFASRRVTAARCALLRLAARCFSLLCALFCALLCVALRCFALLCVALRCFALLCVALRCFVLLCIALYVLCAFLARCFARCWLCAA